MKSKMFIVTTGLLLSSLANAQTAAPALELINDPTFACGVQVRAPLLDANGKEVIEGNRILNNCASTPPWKLSQWNSIRSIPTSPTINVLGGAQFSNSVKRVTLGPIETAQVRELDFAVNSEVEYGGKFRRVKADPWVHLLLGQNFTTKIDGKAWDISVAKSLNLSFDFRLTKAVNNYNVSEGYSASLHASQYLVYFFLQGKTNTKDFVYLGVPLYDDRKPTLPRWIGKDYAKQRLIFSLGFNEDRYVSQEPRTGQWVKVQVDLVPKIQEAINYGFANGVISSNRLADYRLTGMSMGWEVPGRANVSAKAKNLSLKMGR